MFDLDLARLMIVGALASLLITGLRFWAPKAAARRLEQRGSIIGLALKPTYEQQAMNRSALELQELASRKVHDDMLAAALELKRRARAGTDEERLQVMTGRSANSTKPLRLAPAATSRPSCSANFTWTGPS